MRRTGLQLDRGLLLSACGLVFFGIVVLYSAGQTDVTTRAAGVWYKQFVWLAIGCGGAWVAYQFSPRILEWLAPAAYGVSVLLLGLTLVIGTGAGTAAGSKSWLSIGGVQLGQPSELAKVAVVLMLARVLSGRREPPRSLRELLPACLVVGVPFLLVMKQPDLGSAIVFVGILFAMLFWAGTPVRYLVMLASPGVSLLLAFSTLSWSLWIVSITALLLLWRPYFSEGVATFLANVAAGTIAIPLWSKLAPYQQNRLLTFLNPEADPQRAGYHAIQSKVAIGSGGLLGQGYTAGPQKRLAFLPEQHTDFVFSVVGEELGFVGVAVALVLFLSLFLSLVRIARSTGDSFSSLVAFGILGLLFTHVFENVGMTVNLMPITGIPLPFFSYGGSFFIICLSCLGLCFRIAADSRKSGYLEF
jgi:rod shape determining protein RodA